MILLHIDIDCLALKDLSWKRLPELVESLHRIEASIMLQLSWTSSLKDSS